MGCRLLFSGIGYEKEDQVFKSLRFRILIILVILLGIVPSVIVTQVVIANYEEKAVADGYGQCEESMQYFLQSVDQRKII